MSDQTYSFGKSDTIKILNKAFDPVNGHCHDGTDSAPVEFPSDYSLASGKIIVGNAQGAGAAVDMSGDATISNTGAVTIGKAIDNNKIKDNAGIAFSKLAELDDGYILIGSGTKVATKKAVSGDVALANTGVTTVGSISAGLTLSSEDLAIKGTEAASLTKIISLVDSQSNESTANVATLADGTKGQIKIFILKTDGEAVGFKVTPAHFANGTTILFEDAGDGCIMIFDGTNWSLLTNIGGTVS